jgi:hypothetical protein
LQQGATCTDEHTMPLDALTMKLETDVNPGLTTEAAKSRLERDGPNTLTPPSPRPHPALHIVIIKKGYQTPRCTGPSGPLHLTVWFPRQGICTPPPGQEGIVLDGEILASP